VAIAIERNPKDEGGALRRLHLSGEKQSPIAVTIENIPNYEVFQRASDLE
jgi:hypothetical protein